MHFPLTPMIHDEGARFLSDTQRLFDLVSTHGSPLNVLFPQLIKDNIASFLSVLESSLDRSVIYYAHKPNKSAELLEEVKACGVGVDVASSEELQQALQAGFDPQCIEATGPKNDRFIQEGVAAGILFNIDSQMELKLVIAQSIFQQKKTRIFVRLNGFVSRHSQVRWSESRFGVLQKDIGEVIARIAQEPSAVDLQGFSFHINAGSKKERLIATESAIECILMARKHGLRPQWINIGGGFHINYLASENEWHDYVTALKQAVLGKGRRLSWNDSGLGFKNREGVLEGGAMFGEFYRTLVKGGDLQDFLDENLPTYSQPVKTILNEMLIGLAIEPGRAILDQVGMTVASVLDVKETSLGDQVVIVDMNRSNINAIDMELMSDPVLLTTKDARLETFPAFIAGNLCLHSDIVYRHVTFFPSKPNRGDLLVFVNTAAYQMNFAESRTLGQPIAKTIVIKDNAVCAIVT